MCSLYDASINDKLYEKNKKIIIIPVDKTSTLNFSSSELQEFISIYKQINNLPEKVFTPMRCRENLIKIFSVDLVKDHNVFEQDRRNWINAIQRHDFEDGSEIAILLFDTLIGDDLIPRNELIRIWDSLINKAGDVNNKKKAILLRQLGILEITQGRFQDAIHYLSISTEIALEIGDFIIVGDNYYETGITYRNLGRLDKAWESFMKAEEYTNRILHYKTILYAQGQRAHILSINGEYEEAISLLQSSLELWKKIPNEQDRLMRHTTLHTLGRVYFKSGQYDLAEKTLKQSLVLKNIINERFDSILETTALLCEVFLIYGKGIEINAFLSLDDIENCINVGSYLYASNALRTLSKYSFRNSNKEAIRYAKQSLSCAEKSGNPISQIESALWLGVLRHRSIWKFPGLIVSLFKIFVISKISFPKYFRIFRENYFLLKNIQKLM